MSESDRDQTPHRAGVALLLIDVINAFDFPGAEAMLDRAEEASERISVLKARVKEAGLPVVYCNDHFGQWRENFEEMVERYCTDDTPGCRIVKRLRPEDDDYFVLKPRHSAFFETPLPTLLDRFGAHTLILTGYAGDICVLSSAMDAYLREFRLVVPEDCTASEDPAENDHALAYVRRVLDAQTPPSEEVDLDALREPPEVD
jgi:nicotinamidase-related amidase